MKYQLFNQKGSFNTVPNVRIDVEIKCVSSPPHKINVCAIAERWRECAYISATVSKPLLPLLRREELALTNVHQEKRGLVCLWGGIIRCSSKMSTYTILIPSSPQNLLLSLLYDAHTNSARARIFK